MTEAEIPWTDTPPNGGVGRCRLSDWQVPTEISPTRKVDSARVGRPSRYIVSTYLARASN